MKKEEEEEANSSITSLSHPRRESKSSKSNKSSRIPQDRAFPKRFKLSISVQDLYRPKLSLLPAISVSDAIKYLLQPRKPFGDLKASGTTVYGRDYDMIRVIKLLESDVCIRSSSVSILRIVGACGVGKSTLANLVYNSPTVCGIFETRAWVCANHRLDVRGLTKAIVESLLGISCSLTELTQIQESLKEELMGKRFLIVLDNVCDEELTFWSSLLPPLTVGANGSTIIATTRHGGQVDMDMDMVQTYQLSPLYEMDSMSALLQHAFHLRNNTNLGEIAKDIILMTEGLPLVLNALIRLVLYTSIDFFNGDLKDRLWDTDKKSYPRALRLGYHQLNRCMKQCFEYCSLFPKGYLFEKDHLVRLWVSSNGFVKKSEGKQEQDTGNEYFDELVRRSFFQYSTDSNPMKKNYFVMHDLFHDLAQDVSASMCFRAETSQFSGIPELVCHLSVAPCEFDAKIELGVFKNFRYIQTFLLINGSPMKWDADLFHIEDLGILDNLFSHLTGLRTLDLSFSNIEVVLESIANLQLLCYLALNRTKIRRLPDSICRLHKLQTLELQGCNYLSELPACIIILLELQNLLVWKEAGSVLMPSGIGQLIGLRTLSTFMIGREKQHCEISELRDLMNLRGALCIGGIKNVVNGEEAKEARLEMKRHLRTLTLQWLAGREDLETDQSAEVASEVLVNLQPHNNLEELTIQDYSGDQFPQWIANPSFSHLFSITFDNCCECSILPPLGQLPSLKYLSIRMMDGVQQIGHEFCGSGTSRGFPSLEGLKLWDMYGLKEWFGIEDKDFPCLRNLSISRCTKLKRLPCFTSLVELSIHSCAQLLHIPTLPCLESLKIESLHNHESLSQQLGQPALKILEISHCKKLVSIGCLSRIVFLEQLKVIKCPKLDFSPDLELPLKLKFVEIRHCNLLSNWHPNDFEEITNAHQVLRKLVRQKYQG